MDDFSRLLAISQRECVPLGTPWIFDVAEGGNCLFTRRAAGVTVSCRLADIVAAGRAGLVHFVDLDNDGTPIVLASPRGGFAVFWDDPAKVRITPGLFDDF